MNININKELNGLPFGLPSKHTLQNMLTHQLLRVTKSLEMVRLRRLELPRVLSHSDLNAARLPVPPQPHIKDLYSDNKRICIMQDK